MDLKDNMDYSLFMQAVSHTLHGYLLNLYFQKRLCIRFKLWDMTRNKLFNL